jgi:ribosomal protein L24
MASVGRFQNEQRVRVKKGPFAGKVGRIVDLLPGACKVKIGRCIQWFTADDDVEHIPDRRATS